MIRLDTGAQLAPNALDVYLIRDRVLMLAQPSGRFSRGDVGIVVRSAYSDRSIERWSIGVLPDLANEACAALCSMQLAAPTGGSEYVARWIAAGFPSDSVPNAYVLLAG